MKRLAVITASCSWLFLTGCSLSYVGYYQLPPGAVATRADRQGLVKEVEQVLLPLGFRKVNCPFDRPTTLEYANRAPIAVARDGRWAPFGLRVRIFLENARVFIDDIHHDHETLFVRFLKEGLEKRLRARYGLVEVKFVRLRDYLR